MADFDGGVLWVVGPNFRGFESTPLEVEGLSNLSTDVLTSRELSPPSELNAVDELQEGEPTPPPSIPTINNSMGVQALIRQRVVQSG